jgi:hypothetical protein
MGRFVSGNEFGAPSGSAAAPGNLKLLDLTRGSECVGAVGEPPGSKLIPLSEPYDRYASLAGEGKTALLPSGAPSLATFRLTCLRDTDRRHLGTRTGPRWVG